MEIKLANEDKVNLLLQYNPSDTLQPIQIKVLDECTSTSTVLFDEQQKYFSNNISSQDFTQRATKVLIAHHQSAGRGQRGNSWVDNQGAILFSICWHSENVNHLPSFSTLIFGISVIKTIAELDYKNIKLKWPNDLYYQSAKGNFKLGGMLLERKKNLIVLGLGINVAPIDNKQIDNNNAPISLFEINPKITTLDLSEVIAKLILTLNKTYKTLLQTYSDNCVQDFSVHIENWTHLDALVDNTNTPKTIRVLQADKIIQGKYAGINNKGGLQIIPEGSITPITVFSAKVEII